MIFCSDLLGDEKLDSVKSNGALIKDRICVRHFESLAVNDNTAKGCSSW